jgi:hypothetical protein
MLLNPPEQGNRDFASLKIVVGWVTEEQVGLAVDVGGGANRDVLLHGEVFRAAAVVEVVQAAVEH